MGLREEQFVYEGRRMGYVDTGRGLPVLLLLHGHCCRYTDWQAQLAHGVGEARLIAPDLPYYGVSDPGPLPHDHAWSARALWALLDDIGIDRVVPVGHSAGSMVVYEMLQLCPGRVPGFVLVDAGRSCWNGSNDIVKTADASPALRALRRKNGDRLVELGYPWAYPSDENVCCLEAFTARRATYRRNVGDDGALVTEPPTPHWSDVPALVFAAGRGVAGQDDVPPDWAQSNGPSTHSRVVVVRDSGHWVMRDAPAVFDRELLAFVNGLSP